MYARGRIVVEQIHEYLASVGQNVRSGEIKLDDFIIHKVSTSSNHWSRSLTAVLSVLAKTRKTTPRVMVNLTYKLRSNSRPEAAMLVQEM